ncbi:MAG TPA: DUF3151 family protein [Acidimicrobiia bacterium]|nr:DUF3151 family protein [Acidimicrobiia bacterium]
MSDVSFTPSGPPETVLPDPAPSLISALDASGSRADIAAAVAAHPADPLGWATLGDAAAAEGDHPVAVYAYYRVGYHRGLDLLRKNGWKGSGYVRSGPPSNHGFLRCLAGLAEAAAAIGESDEAERCRQFLHQLDPKTD